MDLASAYCAFEVAFSQSYSWFHVRYLFKTDGGSRRRMEQLMGSTMFAISGISGLPIWGFVSGFMENRWLDSILIHS